MEYSLRTLRIFRNPIEVLGRALSPPSKEDLGITIRQLL